ncbi:SurA N-terminal domain-containing protein [Pseudomarimonas arenosa]|uniref:Periplasmic chaperone PpiD n=1 Tax=Pseudomarimonas arenosa TaxID=2774145 RepID=A0AAW3ZN31_9GAMM|nr:SurA N-terminal domain-containing protein [Pseudomarimonas arenosa]MBD8526049.1 SurA N-terminal domain-containing protein [Pseudomarimonas arenosa]
MLTALREKTSGWIATIIIGLLIVPFAFFGVNNYFDSSIETWVAKVGESEISQDDFRSRFDQYRQQMRRMLGDNYDGASIESAESKSRLLDNMIEAEVLRQVSQELGLVVGRGELQKEISQMEVFHTNGKFDPQQYTLLLASQGMTPRGFEARMREDMTIRALPTALNDSALATTSEVDNYFRLRDQTRDLNVLMLEAPAADAVADPSEETLQAYLTEHSDRYVSEEQVAIEYVIVDASAIDVPAQASEESLRERYETQKSRYSRPAQRLASHILVKVAADAPAQAQQDAQARADELAKQARGGADFAELAKQHSDDIGSKSAGGDLGWLEPGFLDPAFETALFAMQKDAISDPVKSSEGWHVIQLRDERPGEIKSFEEVRAELEQDYNQNERERRFSELAGRLVDEVFQNPTELKAAADKLGLQLQTTATFGRAGGADPITFNRDVLNFAFAPGSIEKGEGSDPIKLDEARTAVVRVAEHKPSVPLSFAEVRDQLLSDWRREQRQNLADKRADDLLQRLNNGESLADLAADVGVELRSEAGVGRGAVNLDREVVSKAFTLARPAEGSPSFAKVDLPAERRALVEVTKVNDGDPNSVPAMERQAVSQQIAQTKAAIEMQDMIDKAKQGIEIQRAVDRL